MREMQIMAGVVSLVVACVLAVELVLGSAGADQWIAVPSRAVFWSWL